MPPNLLLWKSTFKSSTSSKHLITIFRTTMQSKLNSPTNIVSSENYNKFTSTSLVSTLKPLNIFLDIASLIIPLLLTFTFVSPSSPRHSSHSSSFSSPSFLPPSPLLRRSLSFPLLSLQTNISSCRTRPTSCDWCVAQSVKIFFSNSLITLSINVIAVVPFFEVPYFLLLIVLHCFSF